MQLSILWCLHEFDSPANLSFLLIFGENAGQQCVIMSLCALIYSTIGRITSFDDMIQTVTVGSQMLLVYSSLSLLSCRTIYVNVKRIARNGFSV